MEDKVARLNEDLPYIDYRGRIVYHTELFDIAYACDNLNEWVNKQPSEPYIVPIAFDMEWPFNYQTGAGKSAVIQLCADTNLCYVFQISRLKRLPAALLALLNNPRVCLHGLNIKNDFLKLQRDFPEARAKTMLAQCKDLGIWCNAIINSSGQWSLERLVMHICRLRINKDKSVRQSRWDVEPLTSDQQLYAAIDVYIGQVIYMDLLRREKLKQEALENDEAVLASLELKNNVAPKKTQEPKIVVKPNPPKVAELDCEKVPKATENSDNVENLYDKYNVSF